MAAARPIIFVGSEDNEVARILREAKCGIRVNPDDGPGFDRDQTDALLQPFRQADETRARAHEGAGLGLPVARLFAERHGGALAIGPSAQEGSQAGACVTLSLPAECVVAERATACKAVI